MPKDLPNSDQGAPVTDPSEVTPTMPVTEPPAQSPTPAKKDKSRLLLVLLGGVVVIIVVFAVVAIFLSRGGDSEQTAPEEQKVIGLSLSSLRTERWKRDKDFIVSEAEKSGILVNVTDANDDPNLQLSQAENLILQGVDVLMVVANDAELAAQIVERANQSGVPVIAYDRLILDSDLDYYVSFDSVEVGRIQAQGIVDAAGDGKYYAYIGGSPSDHNATLLKQGSMEILQPKIDSREIEMVLDVFIDDWKQEDAYETLHSFLEGGGQVDAVVCANDGMALGAIQALEEFDLVGTVPVSGQDAELSACQRIVDGTQTVTVYKPLEDLALEAVNLAIDIIGGDIPSTEFTINNGSVDVPAFYVPTVMVTANNIDDTVIEDGFHSYEDIYE